MLCMFCHGGRLLVINNNRIIQIEWRQLPLMYGGKKIDVRENPYNWFQEPFQCTTLFIANVCWCTRVSFFVDEEKITSALAYRKAGTFQCAWTHPILSVCIRRRENKITTHKVAHHAYIFGFASMQTIRQKITKNLPSVCIIRLLLTRSLPSNWINRIAEV